MLSSTFITNFEFACFNMTASDCVYECISHHVQSVMCCCPQVRNSSRPFSRAPVTSEQYRICCNSLLQNYKHHVSPAIWVVGSILHGVDPLSYFSFQPVLHDWCNKGRGMCYPVCGMAHRKEPLLLIDKSSLCGGSGFPFSLSEWSLTI